ncbi:MAG: alcohol dehydrogenase catalytic domain-containing protein [Opitutaceae bacterium]|nr:alcohol dehydrogenase catalytic domain-containing protein [Opitutaceae bacterium]
MKIPTTQRAIQLVGPNELRLNPNKPVPIPGPRQVLCRVEVCGLCFSDLKLLKQFSGHARKSEVKAGIDPQALREMPHYVPGDKPVVPGHETVVRIAAVGPQVARYKVGERYLVQTDYRWLPTANSASAFGYNFEGALQEYVLVDERVITAPEGESMLIPAPEDLPASAIALCEPWACVEDAYVEQQRRTLQRSLVVGDGEVPGATRARPDALPAGAFDEVIYFGSDPAVVEKLFASVAAHGLLVICQCGGRFGRPVVAAIGRVHYGGIRIVGTTSRNVADALAGIPATAEIRPHDKVNIIGAAGPMGTMHVIRDLCQGVAGVTVLAGDLSDERLAALRRLAEPLAAKNRLTLKTYNPARDKLAEKSNYIVLMAPVPALVAQAVKDAAPKAIINIFAGIPADKTGEIDLDAYIEKQCYFIGTSGSTLDDMKAVLAKVKARTLDTNLSVAAVAGLDGAIDGIHAVEKNTLPGKIVVYPSVRDLPLTPVPHWNAETEQALLKQS